MDHRIISYSALDILPIEAVNVIAVFNTRGNVKPIYLQYNKVKLKVTSYSIASESRISIDYNCMVSDGEREAPLYLTYYKAEGVWAVDSGRIPR